MRRWSKVLLSILILLFLFFVVYIITAEKYCYNFAFVRLDQAGIKLGQVKQELADKGISPLQVGSNPGMIEWTNFYLGCKRSFSLLNINLSVFEKSYPQYWHFIDW